MAALSGGGRRWRLGTNAVSGGDWGQSPYLDGDWDNRPTMVAIGTIALQWWRLGTIAVSGGDWGQSPYSVSVSGHSCRS